MPKERCRFLLFCHQIEVPVTPVAANLWKLKELLDG
jgi:hypothetical protein